MACLEAFGGGHRNRWRERVDEKNITIQVSSDVGRLHEVIVGPVKAFTFEDIVSEFVPTPEPHVGEVAAEIFARYPVHAPDPVTAVIQHEQLVALLAAHGVTLHWAHPADAQVQLYTRDMGFVIDDVYFPARPASPIRRREQAGLAWLLPRLSKVRELRGGCIEGSDVLVTDDDVLVGLSGTTNEDGLAALRAAMAAEGIDRRVVPLTFAHPEAVHLNVHFTMAGADVGLFDPPAFARESRSYLESRFDLVDVTPDEVRRFAVNALALAPNRLIVEAADERIAAEVHSRGITPIPIDYSAISCFSGGIHRSVLPLVRG
ncbi:dimethylarginine dimethylaminohydrolase family protein [Nonomuraea deserti]|uniref:dimethylarginine dimethylaminohydrolase family protein n=1 Tax=Nonomuraea deserti TaxID=1848322 RepID=UPI0014052595|nr:arginine deiminase family protein [Nonomuraea deserti]